MNNVHCTKDELLDYPKVRQYIEEHAPIPFDKQKFYYGLELDAWLHKEIPGYNTYRIFIGTPKEYDLVLKRYSQTLPARKGKTDELENVERFDLCDSSQKIIARGWYGIRKDNIGQLASGTGVDSLRVRVGNILIGDSTLTDQCFSETRFNGYLVGEIHVITPALTPNARRDDFEDSDMKSDFFNAVRRLVEPLVKKCREDSDEKNSKKKLEAAGQVIIKVSKQLKKGFVGDATKKENLSHVRSELNEMERYQHKSGVPIKLKEEAEKKIEQLRDLESEIKAIEPNLVSALPGFSQKEREAIQLVLNAVAELYDKTETAAELERLVINKLNRQRH
ncbi:MAG: hypothetical protein LBQ50_01145 [Planctomycetaceae bacterium]|nr:hypothetical protein [Planctomycetaceae bacterium]